jgi:hypothetical protein
MHIAHLLSLDRPSDISKALYSLPRGLEKTYDDIFEQIMSQDEGLRDIALRSFQWLLARDGKSGSGHLIAAVCQDSEKDEPYPVDISPEVILKACRNLIIVDRNLWDVSAYGVFCFAHLSVQEYCETRLWSSQQAVHSYAAKICLFALLHSETVGTSVPMRPGSETKPTTLIDSYLKQFADEFWLYHLLRGCSPDAPYLDKRLQSLLSQFLNFSDEIASGFRKWASESCEHQRHQLMLFWCKRAKQRRVTLRVPYLLKCSHSAPFICFFGLDNLLQASEEIFNIPPLHEILRQNIPIISHLSTLRMLRSIMLPLLEADAQGVHMYLRKHTSAQWVKREYWMLSQGQWLDNTVEILVILAILVHALGIADAKEICGSILAELISFSHDNHARREEIEAGIIKVLSLGTNPFFSGPGNHRFPVAAVVLFYLEGLDRRVTGLRRAWPNPKDVWRVPRWRKRWRDDHPFYHDLCQLLVKNGPDTCGDTLVVLSLLGNEQACRLLIQAGADANTESDADARYPTSLIAACATGRLNICRLLIENGADVNSMRHSKHWGTAIVAACGMGHTEVARFLIEHGAEVNQNLEPGTGKFGTALVAASVYGHKDTCEMLVDNGADMSMTTWRISGRHSHAEIVFTNALAAAIWCSWQLTCHFFLSRRFDVNISPEDETGCFRTEGTPLIAATCKGEVNLCKVLLDHGADPNTHPAVHTTRISHCAYGRKLQTCRTSRLEESGHQPDRIRQSAL